MIVPSRGKHAPLGLDATLHQIGVIVRNLEEGMAHYGNLLGLGPYMRLDPTYEARFHDWRGTISNRNAFAKWGDLYLEMVEPGLGEGVHRHWLETRGEGIFHLGFWTDDMNQRPAGVEVCFESLPPGGEGKASVVMFDTLDTLGWYVEIAERALVETLNSSIDSFVAGNGAPILNP